MQFCFNTAQNQTRFKTKFAHKGLKHEKKK